MTRKNLLPAATALIFVGMLSAQVWTYASGQDSGTYMEIARGLQRWVRGEAPLTDHLSLVAPLYPGLLAVVREFLGPFAAYWVNPVLCALWILLAGRLAARITGEESAAPAMLLTACSAFLGYGLYPHFALYAFRSPLMLVLMLAGFLLLLQAAERGSLRRLAAAWLCLTGAVLVREFAAIGWVCAAGWWAWRPGLSPRLRWTGSGLFLFPLVAALLSLPVLILGGGSEQIRVFITIILRQAWEQGGGFLWANLTGCLRGLAAALDPWGLLFLAAGVCALHRNRAARWFLAAPGLFLLLAYVPFLVHQRYIQEALAFLALIAGIGLHDLCRRLQSRLPAGAAGWVAPVAQLVLIAAVVVPRTRAAEPWGDRVTRSDIRGMLRALARVSRPGDRVVLDPPEGRVWEALAGFSELQSMEAHRVLGRPPSAASGILCVESRDGAGWSVKKALRQRSARAVLQDAYDLVEWSDSFSLGGADYRGWSCQVRTSRVERARFQVQHDRDHLVWMDFGSLENRIRVLWFNHKGEPLGLGADLASAQGWRPVFLPRALTGDGVIRIRVEAREPVPAGLEWSVLPSGRAMYFDLGPERRASTLGFFNPEMRMSDGSVWGVLLRGKGRIMLPPIPGLAGGEVAVSMSLRPAGEAVDLARCTLTRAGVRIGEVLLAPDGRGGRIGGLLRPGSDGAYAGELELSGGASPAPCWITDLRVLLPATP
ncbi:MAG: hypothetical protein U1F77_01465 [Kiritimatiellia bacterium]